MFERSLTLIPELQKDLNEVSIMTWVFISDTLQENIAFVPLALTYFILQERPRCVYFVFIYYGIEFVYKMIKMSLH